MFKKEKILLGFSIFMFISFIGFSYLGSAQTSVAMLDSFYTDELIEIDGVLSENEYDLNLTTTYTIYDYANQANQKEVFMYSSYNDTHLFIGISVDDNNPTAAVSLFFRTNDTVDYFVNISTMSIAENNDIKGVYYLNFTTDAFTTSFLPEQDINVGGTIDVEGACWTRGNGFDFEMKIILNSSDTNGHDVSLEVNDEIDFFIYYESDVNYFQVKSTDVVEEFGTLWLAPPSLDIPSFSLTLVIVSILGVSALLVIKHRRK